MDGLCQLAPTHHYCVGPPVGSSPSCVTRAFNPEGVGKAGGHPMTATPTQQPGPDGDAAAQPPKGTHPWLAGHSPDQYRPLGGYLTLLALFTGLWSSFGVWFRRSKHSLPEQLPARDLALLTVATYKTSRVIAKDRVTSAIRAPFTEFQGDAGPGEVDEAATGRGLRLAIGELLVCPYCLGPWIAAPLTAGFLVFPRATRWVTSVLTAVAGADLLHIAYKKAEDTL